MATATVASDLAKLLADGENTIIKGWLESLQRSSDARISRLNNGNQFASRVTSFGWHNANNASFGRRNPGMRLANPMASDLAGAGIWRNQGHMASPAYLA